MDNIDNVTEMCTANKSHYCFFVF